MQFHGWSVQQPSNPRVGATWQSMASSRRRADSWILGVFSTLCLGVLPTTRDALSRNQMYFTYMQHQHNTVSFAVLHGALLCSRRVPVNTVSKKTNVKHHLSQVRDRKTKAHPSPEVDICCSHQTRANAQNDETVSANTLFHRPVQRACHRSDGHCPYEYCPVWNRVDENKTRKHGQKLLQC
jgi:hypothetical protein